MQKTALITGASRGIGKAIAIGLAADGFDVVINYVSNQEKAQETVDIAKSYGVKAIAIKANVSRFEEAQTLVDAAFSELGSLNVLVNNAGITRDGLLARMKEKDFDDVIDVNLKSVFNCCRFAAPYMMKQREGRIINISSVIGLIGNAGQVNYAASKAGVLGITKSMARELAPRNITVNAIAPGYIMTDMTEALPQQAKEKMSELIPLRRLGTPEDVARMASFLASEGASYITGQVFCVDGGLAI
ncbi:MAG: 3-oxoacyl-[acyl-carrier-protein] reductase [Christensenellales bacterium]